MNRSARDVREGGTSLVALADRSKATNGRDFELESATAIAELARRGMSSYAAA